MSHGNTPGRVTDEARREFVKALGVAGAVAAGGVALGDVREAMTAGSGETLAPIGRSIRSDLEGRLDVDLLATRMAEVGAAANELPAAREQGLPVEEPRGEFATVAAAARPIYEHLGETGFFGSTTEQLPAFDPPTLSSAVETFVGSERLAEPLADLGLTDGAGVDLLSEVIANAERLHTYHWVATDEIPRETIELGEHIPPMTKAAAGGVLLWLEDLDQHLWQKQVLLTAEIHDAITWHARSMAAGFQLMSEGARTIATESGTYSDAELGAMLSTGFAVQAIAQNLLLQEGYWITEETRAPRAEVD